MLRLTTLLFLISAIVLTASAQRSGIGVTPICEIHGHVRFPPGQQPTSGVVVSYGGGGGFSGSTEVDRSGKFDFISLSPGMYSVWVTAPGYRSARQDVNLMQTPRAFVVLDLVPASANNAPLPATPHATGAIPDTARQNVVHAQQLLAAGNQVDNAVELLKKAIGEYPHYTEAYLLMGAAYESQKNWPEATKAFKKALELDGKNASAYMGLGSVENNKESFAEAETYLLKAVALAPDAAEAHWQLACAYYGEGRWEMAHQQVAKTNELRPGIAQQHVVMGNILLRERNAAGALKEFQEAVRLDPNGPSAAQAREMIERIETALKQASGQKQ